MIQLKNLNNFPHDVLYTIYTHHFIRTPRLKIVKEQTTSTILRSYGAGDGTRGNFKNINRTSSRNLLLLVKKVLYNRIETELLSEARRPKILVGLGLRPQSFYELGILEFSQIVRIPVPVLSPSFLINWFLIKKSVVIIIRDLCQPR